MVGGAQGPRRRRAERRAPRVEEQIEGEWSRRQALDRRRREGRSTGFFTSMMNLNRTHTAQRGTQRARGAGVGVGAHL